jgi:hypothetical protein
MLKYYAIKEGKSCIVVNAINTGDLSNYWGTVARRAGVAA